VAIFDKLHMGVNESQLHEVKLLWQTA